MSRSVAEHQAASRAPLSNQPAPANTAPIANPPANQQNAQNTQNVQTANNSNNAGPRNTQRNETSNYEVDRTIRHTKMNVGDVQRLSVAVVVNYKTLPDGKPLPLTAEQMKQIEDLTREAMGFSDKRGDTLNVVNFLHGDRRFHWRATVGNSRSLLIS